VELLPGNPPESTPLPAEFFRAFGELAGRIALDRSDKLDMEAK